MRIWLCYHVTCTMYRENSETLKVYSIVFRTGISWCLFYAIEHPVNKPLILCLHTRIQLRATAFSFAISLSPSLPFTTSYTKTTWSCSPKQPN